jgi:hypothetical protein
MEIVIVITVVFCIYYFIYLVNDDIIDGYEL